MKVRAKVKVKVTIIYNSLKHLYEERRESDIAEMGVLDEVEAVKEALNTLGIDHSIVAIDEDIQNWLNELLMHKPDVIFNLCEAISGESRLEMNVPSVLELIRIPYTGASPLNLGICQNKALTKDILRAHNIPTPDYCIIDEKYELIHELPRFPLILKPLYEDGSIGIDSSNVVEDHDGLRTVSQRIINTYHQPVIAEEYIDGRELNVSIIGDASSPQPLPISEIVFTKDEKFKVVGYRAKWVKDSEEYKSTVPVCPAQLEEEVASKIQSIAVKAYSILGCRDYARVDIRLRGDIPYVIEVNPNPDISLDSGFSRSLRAANIPYPEFIWRVISSALERGFGFKAHRSKSL
ncbi:MAG: ATP-grasp domain-containing protein [Nitrososphaerota archaeon]|nr:ATP-grasp domain-containing protein [Nitrososphaerota archaeon]